MELENFVALGVFFVGDNVAFSWERSKCMMFLTLTAIARMIMWNTRQNVMLYGSPLSRDDLIAHFKHQQQPKMKV